MAKYEDRGYCPANALQLRACKPENPVTAESLKRLESRVEFMVYPFGSIPEGEPLILKLMDAPSISKSIAGVLRELIPMCIYPEIGKTIELKDVDPSTLDDYSEILICGDGFQVGIEVKDEAVLMQIAKA